jgi:secreted PhoX family phosphatase
MRELERRDFLRSGLVTIGAALAGPSVWRSALAAPAQPGAGPYGPLGSTDANGLRLPQGFTARVVARSRQRVAGTGYDWHDYPDGGATFPTADGGWIYASNSEVAEHGGVGCLRFDRDGTIVDAYRVLGNTSRNCAGGPTPWGTWLSCEEHARGMVWECDPTGSRPAVARPALGVFTHEAAAVDPTGRRVYLTEDRDDGGFYRFTPARYPDLRAGVLEIAMIENLLAVTRGGASRVTWRAVPDPTYRGGEPTRRQVRPRTSFDGGEGCWYDDGVVYFTTKGDTRVWAYDTTASSMDLLYDDDLTDRPVLHGVDNVYVSPRSGDVFVAEDGGDLEIVLITPDRMFTPFLRLVGQIHDGSEITGPALDPAGERLYFSSQRSFERGVTYEVRGPFRSTRGAQASPTPSPTPTATTPSPTPSTTRTPTAAEGDGSDALVIGAIALAGAATAAAGARRFTRRRRNEGPA